MKAVEIVDRCEWWNRLLYLSRCHDVDYKCKLFREYLKRDIPSVYVRLLLIMYTNIVVKVSCNGACSTPFDVTSGVKQGGIVSTVLLSGLWSRSRRLGLVSVSAIYVSCPRPIFGQIVQATVRSVNGI